MIANRKRLKIDFKLRKILPRNKTISENCTNRFLNQKYVDCNHEGTKNYTVPNFFRESFCGMAQSTKIIMKEIFNQMDIKTNLPIS